ncbi:MAG: hypothetical protein DWQ36_14740 [Acidobacteria bacterium]|nr:MAG: hypothetical protein DWQ30_03475 [Acidobacteriota bacterium]REK06149.1 MAG: hypothetical protein DWQ36_14740 [Acidobacteriota bacterium]
MADDKNPLWVVLGGLIASKAFREDLFNHVNGVANPEEALKTRLRDYDLFLDLTDLAHVATLLTTLWNPVWSAINQLTKNDILVLPTHRASAAAIGLMIPDTDYRAGLLDPTTGDATKKTFLGTSYKSPKLDPAAYDSHVKEFLSDPKVDERLDALEKVMWHSNPNPPIFSRCGGRYNVPSYVTLRIQPGFFLEEVIEKAKQIPISLPLLPDTPTHQDVIAALETLGAKEGSGYRLVEPAPAQPAAVGPAHGPGSGRDHERDGATTSEPKPSPVAPPLPGSLLATLIAMILTLIAFLVLPQPPGLLALVLLLALAFGIERAIALIFGKAG